MSTLARDIPVVLPDFIEAVMLADSYFSDVAVVVIDPTDTEQQVLEKTGALIAKGGKCGVVLFILPIFAAEDRITEPATGPLRLTVQFQTWELRSRKELTDGNTKTAYSVARHAFALFRGRTIGGLAKLFVPDNPVIERATPPEGKNLRGWQVNFTAQEDDYTVVPKCENVIFSPASGAATTVTISCATASSSIYYTTDGSEPSPTNGTLYTGAITVPVGGFTLIAQATKTSYFPSNIKSADFTKA